MGFMPPKMGTRMSPARLPPHELGRFERSGLAPTRSNGARDRKSCTSAAALAQDNALVTSLSLALLAFSLAAIDDQVGAYDTIDVGSARNIPWTTAKSFAPNRATRPSETRS